MYLLLLLSLLLHSPSARPGELAKLTIDLQLRQLRQSQPPDQQRLIFVRTMPISLLPLCNEETLVQPR